jgi:uridine kinase
LDADDILVVEGIHALNLTSCPPLTEHCFKIYIMCAFSAEFGCLYRVPIHEARLIRRIVRTINSEDFSRTNTEAMVEASEGGENTNVFKYQEEADVMLIPACSMN